MRISSLLACLSLTLFAFGLTGCGGAPPAKNAKNTPAEKKEAHDEHEHEAPHKGIVIELGKEEYHAELVHDEAANKVTIYVYDGDLKNAVPITEKDVTINLVAEGKPEQFKLLAAPEASDGEGKSSRFELVDEKLAKALDAKDNKARLNISINGSPFVGEIAAHDHH